MDSGYVYDDEYIRRKRELRAKRKRKKRRLRRIKIFVRFLLLFLIVALVVVTAVFVAKKVLRKSAVEKAESVEVPDWIDVQFLDKGNPSRSGELLDGINDIVVHYVGNPGTTAQQNHDYYNNMQSNVSSHFVIGLDGEIIQCIPLNEKSAASNDRNHDTISIEVCHPDEDGQFTDASYKSLVKLVDWLMKEFHLTKDHVIRHYDVTGKECPRFYVRNPEAWENFLNDL